MSKESNVHLVFICLFIILLLISMFSLNKYQYYLPGDSTYHWKQVNEIINEKKIISYNAIFPESPLFYPPGYHVLMSSYSLASGIDSKMIFLFMPLILYLFYFSVIYFFVKRLTKNPTIGVISAFSILFFWSGYPGYRIFAYLWPVPSILTPFLILLVATLLLFNEKQHYFTASLLIISVGLIHRATSIILLLVLGLFALFNFIKKEKRAISVMLILVLLCSWASWFIPYSLKAGIPVGEFKAQILPSTGVAVSEGQEISVATQLKTVFNPFISLFYLKNFSLILIVWLLFSIFGLIFFVRELWKNKIMLPLGLLLALVILNSVFIKIAVINDITATLLVPFIYYLLFGIGVYYLLIRPSTKIRTISLIFLVLIMMIASFQIASNLYFERLDIPKYYKISPEAIDYLRNTSENTTIFADGYTSYVLSMLTEKNIYITQPGHIGPIYGINYNERINEVSLILESCNADETKAILNNYIPAYVYIGLMEKSHYRVCFGKFEKNFQAITFKEDSIYYLT